MQGIVCLLIKGHDWSAWMRHNLKVGVPIHDDWGNRLDRVGVFVRECARCGRKQMRNKIWQ